MPISLCCDRDVMMDEAVLLCIDVAVLMLAALLLRLPSAILLPSPDSGIPSHFEFTFGTEGGSCRELTEATPARSCFLAPAAARCRSLSANSFSAVEDGSLSMRFFSRLASLMLSVHFFASFRLNSSVLVS